jgi:hypothetical protein
MADGGWTLAAPGIPRVAQDGTITFTAGFEVSVPFPDGGTYWPITGGLQAETLAASTGLAVGPQFVSWLGPDHRSWSGITEKLLSMGISEMVRSNTIVAMNESTAQTVQFVDGGLVGLYSVGVDQIIERPNGERLGYIDNYVGTGPRLYSLGPSPQIISPPDGGAWVGELSMSWQGSAFVFALDSAALRLWQLNDAGFTDVVELAPNAGSPAGPALDAPDDNDVYAVVGTLVYHISYGVPGVFGIAPTSVQSFCTRNGFPLVGGDGGVFEWNGSFWYPSPVVAARSTVVCGGPDVWALLDGRVLRSTGLGSWVEHTPPITAKQIIRLRTGEVYVFGTDNHSLMRWGGP